MSHNSFKVQDAADALFNFILSVRYLLLWLCHDKISLYDQVQGKVTYTKLRNLTIRLDLRLKTMRFRNGRTVYYTRRSVLSVAQVLYSLSELNADAKNRVSHDFTDHFQRASK